jgi:hypothetical protein
MAQPPDRGEIREFQEQNTRLHNATREDLNHLRSRVEDGFARVDGEFARVAGEFARVDDGFVEMRGKLDAAAAGQQQIVGLLNTLIAQQGGQHTDQ